MASSINKYAQNIARARYQTQGGTRSVPVSGRTGATIDPSLFSGKTAAPKGATLASRPIEGGPALPSPKEFNPIIDAESGEDPNAPRVETQQPIENRGGSARYMIQGGGPKIDLSFLVPERANKSFDPSKAIGGENVPYQESKGVGGFLRRMLGDESNKQNIEAQQVQGAKWEAENARTKERAERKQDLLEEIDAREKGPNARFSTTEARLTKGEETAARERQLDRDRAFLEGNRAWVAGEEKARREEARDTATQGFQNRQLALAERPRFQITPTGQGGAIVFNESEGVPVGTYGASTIGEKVDPKTGAKSFVPINGGYEPYVPKAKAPPNPNPGGKGGGVDRGTGLLPGGGALTTPTRSGISLGGALNEPPELPPGGGVRLGGALPAPTPQAAPAVVTQPRSATLADQLVNLPGMGAALDMGYYMTPERSARLEESKRQQQAESLKRTRAMQEQAYGDLGPSMY